MVDPISFPREAKVLVLASEANDVIDALHARIAELEALVREPINLHHAGRLYSMLDLIDWFSEWLKRAESLLHSSETKDAV